MLNTFSTFSSANQKFWKNSKSPLHPITELSSLQFITHLKESFDTPDTAFTRGVFKRIDIQCIDLPSSMKPPDPIHAAFWLRTMPDEIRTMFTSTFHQHFVTPLIDYIRNARANNAPLPPPRIHASHDQYISLLAKAESAGMLYWDIVPDQHPQHINLANDIQMSLFAMSKTSTRSRLISWPRIPNSAIPDPPHISLPDPSLFDSVHASGPNLTAFDIDIHNMFHNITLPLSLSRLFPMEPILLNELRQHTIARLATRLPLHRHPPNVLLRPFQATMPMGFKWSVYIAHTFATACLKHAFALFKNTRLAPLFLHEVSFLQKQSTPTTVSPSNPLLLHIIDDIVAITQDWTPLATKAWHRYIRKVFTLNNLPISEHKSCPQNQVITDSVKFIGCVWNLRTNLISPDPTKISNTATEISQLLSARTVPLRIWKRLVGKLIWMSLLNRPLLSITRAVFAPPQSSYDDLRGIPTPKARKEMHMLATLLPLASVNTALPISHFLLAFDASLTAGAVTYAKVRDNVALRVWKLSKQFQHNPNPTSQQYHDLLQLIASQTWTNAITHACRSTSTHINGLEAAAAILTLEWAARTGIRNARIAIVTDSMVVKGAFTKGRSSSPSLSIRCKRFAAISLAQNLRVSLIHVPSAHNPADKYTRLKFSRGAEHL